MYNHQKVGVFGYGKTGQSVVRYFRKKNLSISVFDSRPCPKNHKQIEGVEHYWEVTHWHFPDINLLVLSPGLPLELDVLVEAKAKGVPCVSDLDLFFDEVEQPVFGVTGTNGKSTVTTMLAHVFIEQGYDCRFGGNLGRPALDLISPSADNYVLELSSFQLERTLACRLDAAVLLNISEDHLDHHSTMADYILGKQKIFLRAGKCVFNRDDENTFPPLGSKQASFGLSDANGRSEWSVAADSAGKWASRGSEKQLNFEGLPFIGSHNELNVLAVLAMLSDYVSPIDVQRALKTYEGLEHRYKQVADLSGVSYINDSKATNLGALVAALQNFSKRSVILIAGGDAKGANFEALRQFIDGKLKLLISIGRDGPKIAAVAKSLNIATLEAFSIEQAVEMARENAISGDTVLFCPACASFDMFRNFEERGKFFEKAVVALKGSSGLSG